MTDSQSITLYTSIPPKLHRMAGGLEYGDAYQKECINSWISAGFRVVSINPGSEIAYLANKYPQVRFEDSGSEDVRTRIHVFLRHIAATGEPLSGIINADCYLLDCGSIADRIRAASQESVVLLRRLNLDPTALRPTGRRCPGFDAFLFDTAFLPLVDDIGNWSIGTPWWDFWFPVAMYLAGARLRMLDAPVLLHLDHEQSWRVDDCDAQAAQLWDVLIAHTRKTMSGAKSPENRVLCGVDLANETCRVEQIAERIVPWLHLQAETIRLSGEGVAGNLLSRVLMGLEESQEASLRHQLDTVTFPKWLRSKRAAVHRLRDRVRRQSPSPNLQSPRAESKPTQKPADNGAPRPA